LAQNPNLEWLFCNNNPLINLDVSQNPNLEWLDCFETQLLSLDLSQNPQLIYVYSHSNSLQSLNINNENNTILQRLQTYNNPNLICIQVDDVNYSNNQICDQPNELGWCKDNIATYSEVCALGINNNNNNLEPISIYPNPVNKYFNIKNISNITSIMIYDLSGKLVLEERKTFEQIDMSHLSRGVFLTIIETDKDVFTKKIVKN
jgi:MFS superfamily sulfate permease-like transporter